MAAGSNVTMVSRRLADLRAPQLAEAIDSRSILVQPLGAIEQHGPHLPFSTDLVIAERVAEAAVDRVGDELDVWLLPPLAYTKSNEHALVARHDLAQRRRRCSRCSTTSAAAWP